MRRKKQEREVFFQKLHKLLPMYFTMRQILEKRVKFSSYSGTPTLRKKARLELSGLMYLHLLPALDKTSEDSSLEEGCEERPRDQARVASLASVGL